MACPGGQKPRVCASGLQLPFLAWPGGQKSEPCALAELPLAPLVPLVPLVESVWLDEDDGVSEAEVAPVVEPVAGVEAVPDAVVPAEPEAPALSLLVSVVDDELLGTALLGAAAVPDDEAPVLPEVVELLEDSPLPLVPLVPLVSPEVADGAVVVLGAVPVVP